jgi:hypothetical protein
MMYSVYLLKFMKEKNNKLKKKLISVYIFFTDWNFDNFAKTDRFSQAYR